MSTPMELAAQALEAERLRPMPSSQNADDRLLDLFLSIQKGGGSAPEERKYQAMRRIVTSLRESGTFSDLIVRLVNAEHAARGRR